MNTKLTQMMKKAPLLILNRLGHAGGAQPYMSSDDEGDKGHD